MLSRPGTPESAPTRSPYRPMFLAYDCGAGQRRGAQRALVGCCRMPPTCRPHHSPCQQRPQARPRLKTPPPSPESHAPKLHSSSLRDACTTTSQKPAQARVPPTRQPFLLSPSSLFVIAVVIIVDSSPHLSQQQLQASVRKQPDGGAVSVQVAACKALPRARGAGERRV